MRSRFLQKILLVLGGLLFGCVVLEGGLRLFYPQIFLVHPPGMYALDPEIGYVLTPGFKSSMSRPEFHIDFSTNDIGLRGINPTSPKANTFRILVLGDSQTWGFGVEDNETYSIRLENLLSAQYPNLDIQVLNGGVPGYGTADELAFLKSRGAALQPDLVIVQFLSVNDLKENRTPASTWATIVDGMLASREDATGSETNLSISLVEQSQRWLKKNSYLARLSFDAIGYLGTRAGLFKDINALWGEDFSQEDAKLGQELLVQIAKTSEGLGAECLLLYTTGQAQVIQGTYDRPRSAEVVADAAQIAEVPWIDVSAEMHERSDRNSFYYHQNGHWTPEGHRVVAEILAKDIIQLGLVQSPPID